MDIINAELLITVIKQINVVIYPLKANLDLCMCVKVHFFLFCSSRQGGYHASTLTCVFRVALNLELG